jgi:hypothetical protein
MEREMNVSDIIRARILFRTNGKIAAIKSKRDQRRAMGAFLLCAAFAQE